MGCPFRGRSRRLERQHLCTIAQVVEVVGPCLHHAARLRQELRPVVGSAERVGLAVRQLGLDPLGIDRGQPFGNDRARRRAKSMCRMAAFIVTLLMGRPLLRWFGKQYRPAPVNDCNARSVSAAWVASGTTCAAPVAFDLAPGIRIP